MNYWYYWVLGALLVAAGVDDVVTGKVRNAITLPAIAAGLVGHLIFPGALGRADSLLGLLCGFFIFYAAWKFSAVGGGDVKLMAAVGALAGWRFVLTSLFFGLSVAVVMAMILLIWKRAFKDTFRRLWNFFQLAVFRAKPEIPVVEKSVPLPFGLAMCIGCAIVLAIKLSGVECRLIWL